MPQFQISQHKSHTNCTGIEPETLSMKIRRIYANILIT